MNQMPPKEILDAYKNLGIVQEINNINIGLINKTWLIKTRDQEYILQEVSPIFDVTIHDDAWAVCSFIAPQGLTVPKLISTDDNKLYYNLDNKIFRALKYINGQSYHKIINLTMAEQSGLILGKFHKALLNFNYNYRSQRRQAGDFVFHANNLKQAIQEQNHHEYYARAYNLATNMINNMHNLIQNQTVTSRHIHGDPKISNILFDNNYHALALVDFDTLNKGGWSLEIADALRSWCNPNQEDILEAHVDLEIAKNALAGYGEIMKGLWSAQERVELINNMQAITLCLAMRYLTDVFYEKYWAYDTARFVRPADHNILRAQAMYNLYEDFVSKKSEIANLINKYLN